jgi:hypothetical protein
MTMRGMRIGGVARGGVAAGGDDEGLPLRERESGFTASRNGGRKKAISCGSLFTGTIRGSE